METMLLKILNLSIKGSWLILAVIFVRLFLRRTPKWIICLLWGLAAFRLICPFSVESVFSLIPSAETIPSDIALSHHPQVNSGIPAINDVLNPLIADQFTPDPFMSANPLQVVTFIAGIIWLGGVAVMFVWALASWLRLKKTVRAAIPAGEGVMICDEVRTPFILGVYRPQIYVPSFMEGETLEHVIRHEKAHLERRDHWWKPLGYLILALHWFNPLCWAAYILLCRDIESACDEKVVRDMDREQLAAYSQALLDCSYPRRMAAACPLAFGEAGVKDRIKGVLRYKKPSFLVLAAAALVCAVTVICLMTDPFSARSLPEKLRASMDSAAVEHNRPAKPGDRFTAIDHDVMKVSEYAGKTTVYAWVLYEEYSFDGTDVRVETGSHIPTVMTFDTAADNSDTSVYPVIEYWEPRDGSYYPEDIRAKFPLTLRRKAFDASNAAAQHEKNLQKARDHYGVITGNSRTDLSFLNYENAVPLAADMAEVPVIYCPEIEKGEEGLISPGYAGGNELAKYLDLAAWKKCGDPRKDLSSPGSVEFIISDDYRITVYQFGLAKVVFRDTHRFYRTGRDDYQKAAGLFSPGHAASEEGQAAGSAALRKMYPEYYDLPADQGLTVYVWQTDGEQYLFGLAVGNGKEKTKEEVRAMNGASAGEMREILSVYDISREMITVIAYDSSDPGLSYTADEAYAQRVRSLLFGDARALTVYANWTDSEAVMRECLNPAAMAVSAERHLPVFRLDTKEDLERFRERFRDILTLDRGYDEVPSFEAAAAGYDDAFFREFTVILAYVPASSGSFRYGLKDIPAAGDRICLNVIRTNDPEAYTADMSGWFVLAEVPETTIRGIKEFDAVLIQ